MENAGSEDCRVDSFSSLDMGQSQGGCFKTILHVMRGNLGWMFGEILAFQMTNNYMLFENFIRYLESVSRLLNRTKSSTPNI